MISPEFWAEGQVFVNKMLIHAANTEIVETKIKDLFVKMLKESVIRQETIELVKYITQQDDIK